MIDFVCESERCSSMYDPRRCLISFKVDIPILIDRSIWSPILSTSPSIFPTSQAQALLLFNSSFPGDAPRSCRWFDRRKTQSEYYRGLNHVHARSTTKGESCTRLAFTLRDDTGPRLLSYPLCTVRIVQCHRRNHSSHCPESSLSVKLPYQIALNTFHAMDQ